MFDIVLCQRDFEEINAIEQQLFKVEQWTSDDQVKNHLRDGKILLLITDKSSIKPDLYNLFDLEITKNSMFYHFSDEPYHKDGYFPDVTCLDQCADYYENSGIFQLVDDSFAGIDSYSREILFSCDKYRNFADYTKALFLDRDGVVNVDTAYAHKVSDLQFIEGLEDFLSQPSIAEGDIFIMTNQAGIARGYFSVSDVEIFNGEVVKRLAANGIHITDVEISPYHFEKGVNDYALHSLTRKPHPGMLLKLMHKYPVNLKASLMIGDKGSDCLNIPLLKTCLIQGKYDLSQTSAPVVQSFSEIKNLFFKS